MPKISEFDGMRIYMYWNDEDFHHLPHFHVLCGEHSAAYELNGELLEGELPKTKNKAIREWCLVKHMELQYAWDCTRKKKEVPWIEPN